MARDFGKGNRELYYVDVPQDSLVAQQFKGSDKVKGREAMNLPEDVAKQFKKLKAAAEEGGRIIPVEEIKGPKKVSGPARDIETRAIEEELTDEFADKAEYETANVKHEAEVVQRVMDEDYARAKRIAYGREEPTEGRRVSYFKGVRIRAFAEGDVETLRRLANSNIAKEISEAGQTLRLFQDYDLNDPVSIMRSIDETRKKQSKRQTERTMRDILKQIDDVIKESPEAVDRFLKEIECKY